MKEHPNEALVELLSTARPVVYRRLVARFQDEQLADEVTTDCLVDAWQRWLDGVELRPGGLVSWLVQRATWRALDVLRKRRQAAPLPEEHDGEDGPLGAWAGAAGLAAPDGSERDRLLERLLALVAELPDDERALVEGHHFEGRTDQDLGERLYEGGGRQALGLRAHRARHRAYGKLRARLEKEGVSPQAWEEAGALAV